MLVQLANVTIKMDGFIDLSFKEIMWPFWIIFAVLLGLCFSLILVFVAKLFTVCFVSTPFYEGELNSFTQVFGIFWVAFVINATTFSTAGLVYLLSEYLEDDQYKEYTVAAMLAMAVYSLAVLFITYLNKNNLVVFVIFISKKEEGAQTRRGRVSPEAAENGNTGNQEGNGNTGAQDQQQQQQQKKKKNKPLEVPEFLYMLNSTFFKKATAKERRKNNLFLQKSEKQKQLKANTGNSNHESSGIKSSERRRRKRKIENSQIQEKNDISENSDSFDFSDNEEEDNSRDVQALQNLPNQAPNPGRTDRENRPGSIANLENTNQHPPNDRFMSTDSSRSYLRQNISDRNIILRQSPDKNNPKNP